MAVAFPSSTQATSSDAGGGSSVSVNVDPPSGLTSGDIWLIVAVVDNVGATLQTPSGFTAAHNQVDGDPGYPGVRTFWKAAGSNESAVSVSSSGGQNWILWCASVRITGARTSGPIGNVATTNPSGTGASLDAPDVAIQHNGSGALLVYGGSPVNASPITITAPSGATLAQKRDGSGVWPSAAVAYELRDAGAYTPGNWNVADITEGRIGVTIEILPAGEEEPEPPTITNVDTDDTITSDQTDVVITGTDFDAATVEIRQGAVEIAQSIDSQNATTIQFDVVFEGASDLKHGSATLAVINADDQEDTIAITIEPPNGQLYVDVGTPNQEADYRITAVDDIEAGDQLHARGVGGGAAPAGLHLNADGTFWFEDGSEPAAFDVRVWDGNDATWGAWATQSVGAQLAPADATHSHTADNIVLTQAHVLVVQDALHGHSSETPALTQANVLEADDAQHGHSAENVALTQAHLLVVQDASHDQAADNIVLTVAGVLEVADAAHAHTADSVALTQAHVLAVADAAHGHSADSVTLSLGLLLTVADALHSHAVDNVALTQAHVLTVADALHAHSAANVVLEQAQTLSVDGASHGHTAESPTLSLADILSVADAVHEHTADEIELTQSHVLVVSDALHSHLADAVRLQIPGYVPPAGRVFIVEAPNRTFVVARGNRTFQA